MPHPPTAEFGLPGPQRDRLVAAVLSGTKTSTTSLLREYELADTHPPRPGQRQDVLDSEGRTVGVIELTDVRVARLADVDRRHVVAEGEGFPDVATWRAVHEGFWRSPEMRAELGPDHVIDDHTLVVMEQFRLLG